MSRNFIDFFRCPSELVSFDVQAGSGTETGYFQLGGSATCYARVKGVRVDDHPWGHLGDALAAVSFDQGRIGLPFDPDQASDNLRYERYPMDFDQFSARLSASPMVRDLYYVFRPLMPVPIRSLLQRAHLRGQLESPFPNWPVDRTVDRMFEELMELQLRANGNTPIPFIWFWPEGKNGSLVLTHDVESSAGLAFSPRLMDIDEEYGFRSSFQIVPEKRYDASESLLREFVRRGFEINVHDLNHDGNLFRERDEFRRRVAKINQYAKEFGARGFRSGALYRRLDWYHAFEVSYDMSVPNVAHLDPQNGGCCTIMPYFIGDILELPVTGTQDYSLFHILKQYSLNLWKQQTDIIIKGHGMISLITHPDYLIATEARNTYRQLLAYLADTSVRENLWAALPGEIDRWWRQRHKMHLVCAGGCWQVQGEGSERARIAYASLVNGELEYSVVPTSSAWEPTYVSVSSSAVGYSQESQKGNSACLANGFKSTAVLQETNEVVSVPAESGHINGNGMHTTSNSLPATITTEPPVLQQQPTVPNAAQVSIRKKRSRKPLRVCMVAYTFYEADNRVMRYAETLVQEGHDVEVFALRQGSNPKEETICGVRVRRIQSRVVNEKGQLAYAWRILLFLLRAFYHVSKNDLREKYDLLHIHSVPDFLVFCGMVPRFRGTPVILDIHDILPEFYLGKFGGGQKSFAFRCLTFAEKICANTASHVIIANHIWRERILSRSIASDRCTVVLNSPDRNIFHVSPEPPKKGDRFLLLYPGTLNWHQGLDIAIRAFAKISSQVPQADFHIYGEGPSKPFLADLIKQLGVEGRVQLRNPRRIREIAQVMENADLGIVPKRKDNFGNEAFSTKIFEFMAMRVPVIVSDTKIDRYYFNDSLVRFFKGGDDEDLAKCMLDLIQHPEKRRHLVSSATKYIDQNDWVTKKHEYLNLVARLTGRGNKSQIKETAGAR
jgi:glycosyltransferase involved in cell wall biosynthesis